MHNHVIGVVPKFTFVVDAIVAEQHSVSEILASENFDMGMPLVGKEFQSEGWCCFY